MSRTATAPARKAKAKAPATRTLFTGRQLAAILIVLVFCVAGVSGALGKHDAPVTPDVAPAAATAPATAVTPVNDEPAWPVNADVLDRLDIPPTDQCLAMASALVTTRDYVPAMGPCLGQEDDPRVGALLTGSY